MRKLNFYLIILIAMVIIISSCKEECEDGITFFDECIEDTGSSIFEAEFEFGDCKISFLFDIIYGDQIDAYEYQYLHTEESRASWTLASDVQVGQNLNGGANCRLDGDFDDEITQYSFEVPEQDDQTIPVLLKTFNRFTFETVDSTVITFNRM